jgi:hypothetical protein
MNDLSRYNIIRDLMRSGDVIQWRSDSLLGEAIRLRKGGDINHTSIVIRLQEYEGLERRVFTLEALEHGVVLNLLRRRLESFDGQAYLLRLREQFDPQRQAIGERALSCVGIPYDYPGILQECFGNAKMDLKRLFCSEMGWYALTGKEEGEAPDPAELQEYLSEWFIKPMIPLL